MVPALLRMNEIYEFMITIAVHHLDILDMSIIKGMLILISESWCQTGAHSTFGYCSKWYGIKMNAARPHYHPRHDPDEDQLNIGN